MTATAGRWCIVDNRGHVDPRQGREEAEETAAEWAEKWPDDGYRVEWREEVPA